MRKTAHQNKLTFNNYEVSIYLAAGQVVENTPCPAVKFLVNVQLIWLKLSLFPP